MVGDLDLPSQNIREEGENHFQSAVELRENSSKESLTKQEPLVGQPGHHKTDTMGAKTRPLAQDDREKGNYETTDPLVASKKKD
jgi:hypothetical protein